MVDVRLPEMDVSQPGHPTIRSATCRCAHYRVLDEFRDPGMAMTSGDARAAAAGPVLGFLFQFRFGLLESLNRAKRNLDIVVAFELIDDAFRVSSRMTEVARRLDLEHSEWPARLDMRDLTVVIDSPRGPIPMVQLAPCRRPSHRWRLSG